MKQLATVFGIGAFFAVILVVSVQTTQAQEDVYSSAYCGAGQTFVCPSCPPGTPAGQCRCQCVGNATPVPQETSFPTPLMSPFIPSTTTNSAFDAYCRPGQTFVCPSCPPGTPAGQCRCQCVGSATPVPPLVTTIPSPSITPSVLPTVAESAFDVYCRPGQTFVCPSCPPGTPAGQCRCRCEGIPGAVTPTPLPLPGGECFFGLLCPATHVYVALGDSIAAGFTSFQGYVPRYEDWTEDTNRISIDDRNLAVSGWESRQLAHALQNDPRIRTEISQAQVITWNIGGNDLRRARLLYQSGQCGGSDNQQCLHTTVAEFRQHWDSIVAHLVAVRSNRPVMLRSMDIYNPFVDEDRTRDSWPHDGGLTDLQVLQPHWEAANQHIRSSLTANNILYAPVAATFNGEGNLIDPETLGYISFDDFHPNDRGHSVIAQLLHQQGYADLPASSSTPPPVAPTIPPLPVPPFPTISIPPPFPSVSIPPPLPSVSIPPPLPTIPTSPWPPWPTISVSPIPWPPRPIPPDPCSPWPPWPYPILPPTRSIPCR